MKLMATQQKNIVDIAIELFKVKKVREFRAMNKNDNLEVYVDTEDTNFNKINVWFDDDKDGEYFTVSVDDKYVLFLKEDGRLVYHEDMGKPTRFRVNEKKPILVIRATDCIGHTLMGRFPIEKDV